MAASADSSASAASSAPAAVSAAGALGAQAGPLVYVKLAGGQIRAIQCGGGDMQIALLGLTLPAIGIHPQSALYEITQAQQEEFEENAAAEAAFLTTAGLKRVKARAPVVNGMCLLAVPPAAATAIVGKSAPTASLFRDFASSSAPCRPSLATPFLSRLLFVFVSQLSAGLVRRRLVSLLRVVAAHGLSSDFSFSCSSNSFLQSNPLSPVHSPFQRQLLQQPRLIAWRRYPL